MLYKSLKFLHVVGIILFLGSVFGHVATGVLAGGPVDPGFVAARQNISALTRDLTLPGLGLTIVCGLALGLAGRAQPFKQRWLIVHALLAVAITVLTVAVIVPAGQRVLEDALLMPSVPGSQMNLESSLRTEHLVGAANIVLSLLAICVAVWRPRFARGGDAAQPTSRAPTVIR